MYKESTPRYCIPGQPQVNERVSKKQNICVNIEFEFGHTNRLQFAIVRIEAEHHFNIAQPLSA